MTRHLVCGSCGMVIPQRQAGWRCTCGGLYELEPVPVAIDRARITERPPTMWRYAEALPFLADGALVCTLSMGEGMTPLVPHTVAGAEMSLKLDFLMPTLSYKDRGAVMLVASALDRGATELVADSSGNAGTAISAYAARAGLPIAVYVRAGTSEHKLAQMRAHGASVVEVAGTREDVAAAAMAAVDASGAFYASHVYDPMFTEGTKTCGYEIWEQLGWQAPDVVVMPVGNGTLVLGVARAFAELAAAGAIGRPPRLIAVQAAGCAPIATAFDTGSATVEAVTNQGTVADGIAIAAPARGGRILDAVRASGGSVVTVQDAAITHAAGELAHRGVFVEPTGAATLAAMPGLLASGLVGASEHIVLPLTGAGLKVS